jgi:shikimate dehydrogenase
MSKQLSGATRLFPIIGDPIVYVESPDRFSRTLADQRREGLCIPMQVSVDHLDAVMKGLSATDNVDGVLVTMPHKFRALSYCSTASERARALGAVSVIRRNPDQSWHGDMLDGLAFVEAQKSSGAQIEDQQALLVGAGAAGRAIALALLDADVRKLIVYDDDKSRVKALIDAMPGGRLVEVASPDPSDCDLVFNATPMGMNHDDPLPVDAALLNSSMFVGDVIAGHGITPLIRVASDIGCHTANGNQMVEAVQSSMVAFMFGGNSQSESA